MRPWKGEDLAIQYMEEDQARPGRTQSKTQGNQYYRKIKIKMRGKKIVE